MRSRPDAELVPGKQPSRVESELPGVCVPTCVLGRTQSVKLCCALPPRYPQAIPSTRRTHLLLLVSDQPAGHCHGGPPPALPDLGAPPGQD